MRKSILVSYLSHDKLYKDKIEEWAAAGKLGPHMEVIGWEHKPSQENNVVYMMPDRVRDMITEFSLVIALVGSNNHNHPWNYVEKRFESRQKPRRVVIPIPGTKAIVSPTLESMYWTAYNPNAIVKQLRYLQEPTAMLVKSKYRDRQNVMEASQLQQNDAMQR